MAKQKPRRTEGRGTTNAAATPSPTVSAGQSPGILSPHPPAKNPTLLVASGVLFALWFVFLLFAALWG